MPSQDVINMLYQGNMSSRYELNEVNQIAPQLWQIIYVCARVTHTHTQYWTHTHT